MCPYIYIILPSYAVCAFLGGLAAVLFCYLRLGRLQMEFRDFLLAVLYSGIGAFLGSRLLFDIVNIRNILHATSITQALIRLISGGFVFYGGLFGAIMGLILFTCHHDSYTSSTLLNFAAPAFPLFHFWGRIGCFAAGCCYGTLLKNPLELQFCQLTRIPVQLIESAMEFLLFVLLLVLEQRQKKNLLKWYLLLYALFRFFIEFFRGDEARGILFGLSSSQWISIVVILMMFRRESILK